MIYFKSTLAGLAAALAALIIFWLFTFAVSTGGIGLGVDIPSWHFVLSIFTLIRWSVPLVAFGIGFALACRRFRKRLDHRTPAL
jgi:hypothetical protein